jgi:arylsulfatase A-like enzyme
MVKEPGWAPVSDPGDTFTSVLRRHGYWTAYVTDNPFLGYAPGYTRLRRSFHRFSRTGGQAGGQGRGVSDREVSHWLHPSIEDAESRVRMRRFLGNANDYAHNERRSFAARVFRDATALLDVARRNRPFCMIIDTFEPHEPWTPPRKYIGLYDRSGYRGREPAKPYYAPVSRYMSDGQRGRLLRRIRALYAAEVTMTDRWLGVFLDRLHKLRLDRDTIVVLTSDHGFLLGDHGWTGKSPTQLHPALIRVPLTIVHPDNRRRGGSTRFFAQSHDIGPTILSMAGIRVPRAMNGTDLSPLFRGRRPSKRSYAYGGYTNGFYIRTDRWALIGNNPGQRLRLYDLSRDPRELRNVASTHPGKARQLYRVVRRRSGGRLPYYPNAG